MDSIEPSSSDPSSSVLPELLEARPLSSEDFTAPDFHVDNFLIQRRFTPLDELYRELKKYEDDVRKRLVAVIHEDYEDFVNLSTGLEDAGIFANAESLLAEVKDARTKVAGVQAGLGDLKGSIVDLLTEKATIEAQLQRYLDMEQLHLLSERLDAGLSHPDDDGFALHRIIDAHLEIQFLMKRIGVDDPFCRTLSIKTDVHRDDLFKRIDSHLRASLAVQDASRLDSVFTAYAKLGDFSHCCSILYTVYVKPLLDAIAKNPLKNVSSDAPISNGTAHAPQTSTFRAPRVEIGLPTEPPIQLAHFSLSDEQNQLVGALVNLYSEILGYIGSLFPLLHILSKHAPAHGAFFFTNFVWKPISQAIVSHMEKVIFSTWRLAAFQQSYVVSTSLMSKLESLAGQLGETEAFRGLEMSSQSSSYTPFLANFKIRVYMRLRHKAILSAVSQLPSPGPQDTLDLSHVPVLHATGISLQAFEECFSSYVFLDPLSNEFNALAHNVLQHYSQWLSDSSSNPAPVTDEKKLDLFAAFAMDASLVVSTIKSHPRFSAYIVTNDVVVSQLQKIIASLSAQIVQMLADKSADGLKFVRSVASQARALKEAPSEANKFVSSILKGLADFVQRSSAVQPDLLSAWVQNAADDIAQRYTKQISAQMKTEDSLRWLSRGRLTSGLFGRSSGASESSNSAPDAYVSKQLQLDVAEFEQLASSMGVNTSTEAFDALRRAVK